MKKVISLIVLAACAMMFVSCNNAKKNQEVEAAAEAVEAVEAAADSTVAEVAEFVEAVDSTVVAE